jgi:2-octaprenyl-6-methoxyphenol hydroxylase
MSETTNRCDVIIAGGGSAGLALACALDEALAGECRITILDRTELLSGTVAGDPRAFALSAGSQRMLSVLGVWPLIADHVQPVTAIDITDSSLDDAFRPILVSYDNSVEGEPATWIVEHERLQRALLQRAGIKPAITLAGGAIAESFVADEHEVAVALADGTRHCATLLVAADGRRSRLRETAGIQTVGWQYPQTGIVTTVQHEKPHRGRAVQHFLPGGPFAILPLPGDRSSITWTESEDRAREILALGDAEFLAEVEKRFDYRLGRVALAGPRAAWPLDMHLARAMVANRFALLGDAAHGVHPIAGQGLNLGLRDAAALAEVIADAARLGLDIGSLATLERYQRWRRLDSSLSAAAFDALNRVFSNDFSLLRTARDFGLGLVDRMPGLKQLFVAEAAGLTGEVPRLLRGHALSP